MPGRRPHVKTAYHHGNLREELVTAALEIIDGASPAALTLRAVAERLGVSPTAPYRHFATKDDLLAAVAVDGFAALRRELQRGSARAGEAPLGRYRAVATSYVRFALAHKAHFQVMYGSRPEHFRTGPVAEAGRAAFLYFRDTIVACLGPEPPAGANPTDIAVSAWAYVHGLVTLYFGGQLRPGLGPAHLRELAGNIELFLHAAPAARTSPAVPGRRTPRARR